MNGSLLQGFAEVVFNLWQPAIPSPFEIAPVFLVKDVVKSAEYYRDFLGFRFDRYGGDPPDFVVLQRGGNILCIGSDLP